MNEHDLDFESEVLPARSGKGALEQISRAEVDIQISTAHEYPRQTQLCRRKIKDAALRDEATAAECFYSLSRMDRKSGKQKPIIGPSVRFAEIVANSWGNMRVATRVMDIDDRAVTVAAVAHDLESNVAVSAEVRRKITNRDGRKFSDDMIIVTANAAAAIAYRNAVLKVVPQTEWKEVFQEVLKRQETPTNGQGRVSLEDSRRKMLEAFLGIGVTSGQILRKLGRETVEEITGEDVVLLRGIWNAIKEESSTIEEAFEDMDAAPGVKRSLSLGGKIEEPPAREPGAEG